MATDWSGGASGAASGAAAGSMLLPGIGTFIGGGLGFLMGSRAKPQQQMQYDPEFQQYLRQVRGAGWDAYNRLESPNVNPDFMAAMQAMRGYQGAGLNAMRGLTGEDPSQVSQAMNPWMQQMNPYFDMLRNRGVSQAQMGATSPFGTGAREALATTGALRDVNQQQAQYNVQGYNEAINRLKMIQQLGFNAGGQLQQGGEWLTMLPMLWQQMRMGLLEPGNRPAGSTTTVPQQSSPWQSALGGAMAGAGMFGGRGGNTGGGGGWGELPIDQIGNAAV